MSVIAEDALRPPLRERPSDARYRIAMIAACPMPARRGTPVRIERLANALWARGHHVELITYHIGDDAQAFDFPVHRIFSRPKYWRMPAGPNFRKLFVYDPALALKVWRLLGEKQFDVIHAHHMEGLLVSIPARLRRDVPMIYDAHTMLSSELPTYWPAPMRAAIRSLGGWLDGMLPRRADHIVAVTPDLRDRLIAEHRFDPADVTVVTNGVEMERFADVPPPAPDGFVRLIYSGTLAQYQNVGLLLEAFARAHHTRPDLRLVFSVSSSFAAYESHARRLGIREHIELIPDRFDELAQRLAGAAMAVMPRTKCDGIPQKLLNYMAAGKAIVASAGSAKFIEHERTALVVPNDDVAAFAQAILRLARNTALAEELGRNAREHVQKHYSWQMAAERLEGVYAAAVRSTVPVRA
jgi:glycosyltransferase involved in cell wall biosynthesis